jgi:putative phosphoesterase
MLIISDIHGSISALERVLHWYDILECRHIVLLGDLLNHGPRNPVPKGYDPASVAEVLNKYAQQIIAVRGNCDSEVDQMLCSFPMQAEYNWLVMDGRRLCLTHGHLMNPDRLPPLAPGEAFIYGHTHLPVAERRGGILLFNPGSITVPKGGNEASFGYFNGEEFMVMKLYSGKVMMSSRWLPE